MEFSIYLGDRLMVGHMPLAHSIGVRFPVPQPTRASLETRQNNDILTLHRATRLGRRNRTNSIPKIAYLLRAVFRAKNTYLRFR